MNDSKTELRRRTFSTQKKNKKNLYRYEEFEQILERIGSFGTFQIYVCFMIFLWQIVWAGNYTFIEFVGAIEPDWNCTLKNNQGYMTFKAPVKGNDCDLLKQKCESFVAIKESKQFYSIVGAFKMICDDDNKPELIQIIQSGSMLVGAIIGGHIGDHIGRNTFFFLGQLITIISSTMTTGAQNWWSYSITQGITGFIYGAIEVMVLTTMMELTNNKYRLIPNSSFQWPLAYLSISLIAYLTKDWQLYFIFLNAVGSLISIGFIMFLESPRWLIATRQFEEAAEVLNDIAHCRWNDAAIHFTESDLKNLPSEPKEKYRFYNFFHLFSKVKLTQQTILQMLSMFTYSLISINFNYSITTWENDVIPFVAINGGLRFIIPIIIIFFDFKIPSLGRKIQFITALFLEGLCFGTVIILMLCGYDYTFKWINVLITIATLINDSAFWINIVQISTQRYPTVIRCTAFGFIQAFKHTGYIVGIIIMKPLMEGNHPIYAFIIPEVLIIITIIGGIILQPEVKGKSLKDTMDEVNKGRQVTRLPTGLLQLVSQFRVDQLAHNYELEEAFRNKLSKTKNNLKEDIPKPEQVIRKERVTTKKNTYVNDGYHFTDSDEETFKDEDLVTSLHSTNINPH
ncbi:Solute carrier family 22 member 15 [Strongyloides ratti]|uniref:Solute carrier family 22 member 15 n=1 Tax=Strongyloides ratti TaxID=34506 RepID=A0A090L2V4_STRRB|nr:Solute carrier family 22 member 15 [Strongyloides ratti]CEF64136.1 Solute carrier family 22 member 15 [Strongyloides ratti]